MTDPMAETLRIAKLQQEGKSVVCYLGHEDCCDLHMSERLADEADWEQEREGNIDD